MENFLYERLQNKTPKINVWFAFPGIESFAMSSLGFLSIFKQLDLNENLFVERIYSDTKITVANISDVDVLGFSNSFEIDILTIIKMLKKYQIPLKSSDRKEEHPLIFGGGPVLSANPIPFQEFYDFINIGDGREALDKVFKVLVQKRDCPKKEKLLALSEIDGIWVPSLGNKKIVKKISDEIFEPVCTPILSEKSYFKDTFIVEIERGCPKTCNFCLASWLNLPVRYVETSKILEAIEFGLNFTNKIALLGAYVAGHPDFEKILSFIKDKKNDKNIDLTLSSLRADLTTSSVIETLVACGQKTATIAVEAGSERLRKVINKDLTDKQILKTVETARVHGLKGLKIYAMIGLPTETQSDIEALIDLMKRLKAANKGFDITLSVSSFIPKAHTPFQWAKKASIKELEEKVEFLKKNLAKIGVELRSSSIQWDLIQSVFSRAGISLADYIINSAENGGNLGAFKQTWRKMAKEQNLPDIEKYAELPISSNPKDPLPWDFIKANDKEALQKRFEEALKL